MNIKSVNNNVHLTKKIENNTRKNLKESSNNVDKAEISESAKEMNKINSNDEAIQKYKDRINNKFYDSDKVIKKIAAEVLKDIKK